MNSVACWRASWNWIRPSPAFAVPFDACVEQAIAAAPRPSEKRLEWRRLIVSYRLSPLEHVGFASRCSRRRATSKPLAGGANSNTSRSNSHAADWSKPGPAKSEPVLPGGAVDRQSRRQLKHLHHRPDSNATRASHEKLQSRQCSPCLHPLMACFLQFRTRRMGDDSGIREHLNSA